MNINVWNIVLENIDKLIYTLSLGKRPWDECKQHLTSYYKDSKSIKTKLYNYHKSSIKKFEIDLSESKRKRQNKAGAILSIFNNEHSYQTISSDTINAIQNQMSNLPPLKLNNMNLFDKDTRIVFMDGHVYYYPILEQTVTENYDYEALIGKLNNHFAELPLE